MLEGEWTRKLTKQLAAMVVPYVASKRQPAGMPDRIVWSPLWQGWIEFKNYSTPLGTAQKLSMARLNAIKPGSAFIWRRAVGDKVHVQYYADSVLHNLDTVEVADLLGTCARLCDELNEGPP